MKYDETLGAYVIYKRLGKLPGSSSYKCPGCEDL